MNPEYLLVGIAVIAPFVFYFVWRQLSFRRSQSELPEDSEPELGRDSFSRTSARPAGIEEPDLNPASEPAMQAASAAPQLEPEPQPVMPAPAPPPVLPQEASEQTVQDDQSDEAVQPAEAVAEQEKFPKIGNSGLPERFYYIARLSSPGEGFSASQLREMSTYIIKQSRLQKHQVLMGWESGRWQSLRADGRYRHAIWCVPLCTRSTSLTGEILPVIVRCIRTWMQRLGARVELPPPAEVEEALQAVHEFCEHVDMVVTANLVAVAEDNAVSRKCGEILDIAFAHGMEDVGGRIERRENSETIYVMRGGNGDDLGRKSPDRKLANLHLELDVPRVTRPHASCVEMFEFAGTLGRVLGFRLVDDNGKEIDAAHTEACLQAIEDIDCALREEGIKPGSRLARSLFC